MKEHELWGIISKEEFDSKLIEFTTKYGKPVNKKRLSLEIGDWSRPEIDNRIKITNGKAEFVQKVGEWNNRIREEYEFPILEDVDSIYALHQAVYKILNPKEPSTLIIQHDNYLFDSADVEIKISHQTGKSDKYTFEVELKNEKADLNQICQELGLTPDNEPKDKAFWTKWNNELNLDAKDLTEDQLKQIIKSYLN